MYANYPPGEYLWWNWLAGYGAHYPSLKSSLLIIFAIAMLRDEVHMLAGEAHHAQMDNNHVVWVGGWKAAL